MTAARARSGGHDGKAALFVALAVLALLLALAAAWHWTPLHHYANATAITHRLNEAADEPWMPVLVGAAYVVASLVMFPNTVLCLAVIVALGPIEGTAYAFGGSLLAASAGWSIGRVGGKRIEKLRIRAIDRVSARLRDGGFVQVLTLRVLPGAPFAVTNMVCGAARVRLFPFAAATAVGIAPYILGFALFGHQARNLLLHPTLPNAAGALAIIVVAALLVWWIRSRWKTA